MASTTDEKIRKVELAKIHIAKKDLNLTDEIYRDILREAAGVESSGDLKPAGRRAVLERFGELGWTPKGKSRKPGGAKLANDPRSRKMRALWIELHKAGAVKDSSEEALCKFAHRLTGKERLQWIPVWQAMTVIEALKDWLERVK